MARKKPRRSRRKGLNARQQLFCHEYVVDLNGTAAAIRAGYSAKTAAPIASKLLTKANIRAAVEALQKRRTDLVDIKAADVVEAVKQRAFTDIADYLDYNDAGMTLKPLSILTKSQRQAIRHVRHRENVDGSVVVEFQLEDKTRNIELLMQHMGLLKQNVVLESDGPITVNVYAHDVAAAEVAVDGLRVPEKPEAKGSA